MNIQLVLHGRPQWLAQLLPTPQSVLNKFWPYLASTPSINICARSNQYTYNYCNYLDKLLASETGGINIYPSAGCPIHLATDTKVKKPKIKGKDHKIIHLHLIESKEWWLIRKVMFSRPHRPLRPCTTRLFRVNAPNLGRGKATVNIGKQFDFILLDRLDLSRWLYLATEAWLFAVIIYFSNKPYNKNIKLSRFFLNIPAVGCFK